MQSEAIPEDNGKTLDYRHNLVEAAVSGLQEHFDSVVVIATGHGIGDLTYYFSASRGNIYANLAAVQKYADKTAAYLREPDEDERG